MFKQHVINMNILTLLVKSSITLKDWKSIIPSGFLDNEVLYTY